MDARWPLRAALCTAVLVAGLAACATGASPSAPASATPSISASTVPPSGSAVASATPIPSSTGCPIPTLELALGSDRMVEVEVAPGAMVDTVRFRFGPPSAQARPPVVVEPREPPFLSDPAGLPLDVIGTRVAMVRMGMGMWLYDDAGVPTYGGPGRFDAPGPGIRSVVLAGAFEGYETWLVGYDAGCLSAAFAPDGSLEVRVAH